MERLFLSFRSVLLFLRTGLTPQLQPSRKLPNQSSPERYLSFPLPCCSISFWSCLFPWYPVSLFERRCRLCVPPPCSPQWFPRPSLSKPNQPSVRLHRFPAFQLSRTRGFYSLYFKVWTFALRQISWPLSNFYVRSYRPPCQHHFFFQTPYYLDSSFTLFVITFWYLTNPFRNNSPRVFSCGDSAFLQLPPSACTLFLHRSSTCRRRFDILYPHVKSSRPPPNLPLSGFFYDCYHHSHDK